MLAVQIAHEMFRESTTTPCSAVLAKSPLHRKLGVVSVLMNHSPCLFTFTLPNVYPGCRAKVFTSLEPAHFGNQS